MDCYCKNHLWKVISCAYKHLPLLKACCEPEFEGQGHSARPHGSNKAYTNEKKPRTTKTSRGAERPTTCNFLEDACVPDVLEHVPKEHTEPMNHMNIWCGSDSPTDVDESGGITNYVGYL